MAGALQIRQFMRWAPGIGMVYGALTDISMFSRVLGLERHICRLLIHGSQDYWIGANSFSIAEQ